MTIDRALRLDDFEAMAKETLDPAIFAYYSGGAGDEITLNDNVAAFKRKRLRPRVLVDVSKVDPSTDFLGSETTMPLGIAPNAGQQLGHPDGEVATARAAAQAGVLMVLSTFSNRSLEEVAEAAPGPKWFQLYVHRDRAVSDAMIDRAVAAGFRAIVLTVDLPVLGYRERELRHPVELDAAPPFGNFQGAETFGHDLDEFIDGVVNASVTWEDLAWIRERSGLPVVVKGVLTREDARLAVDHGAAAIVVSNHGGRQLDAVPATIDVLEEIAEEAQGRAEIYLDGGIRRGTDVCIALALGARGVFLGRPYLYALAVAGEAGVRRVLELLRAEVTNSMALLGVARPNAVDRLHVV